MIHLLKQNKGTLLESEIGKKIFPHEVTSPAQAVRILHLLVRKYSKPKAHSYVAKRGLKDCMHETAFLNMANIHVVQ